MAKGRKTGGRQVGVPNRASAKRQAEVAASGITPLDYMLTVMRDESASKERRDDMARAAAPYVHPKLTTVRHGGDPEGVPIDLRSLTDAQLDVLADRLMTSLSHQQAEAE